MSLRTALLLPLLAAGLFAHAQAAQPQLRVQLPATATAPASGRLLVFVEPAASAAAKFGGKVTAVEASPFGGQAASAAGMDIVRLAPGQAVAMDTESLAWPRPFSQLPAGDYYVQAVLDTARDDNYAGRGPDDLLSVPVKMALGGDASAVTLVLDQRLPQAGDPWQLPERFPQALRAAAPAAKAATRAIDFISPALSAFWGRPIHMRGWVVLPPGYDADDETRYPVLYFTHGFGGSQRALVPTAISAYAGMRDGSLPPMIWVLLDESSPTGTHEFADSVNNGPWGQALTAELIPTWNATTAWTRGPRAASSTGTLPAAGPRCGCKCATRRCSAAPGPPRRIPAISTTSPGWTCTPTAPTSIAAPTAAPSRWCATRARWWPASSSSRGWRK